MRRADLYAAASATPRSASSFYLMAIRSAPATGAAPRACRRTRARPSRPATAYALELPGFPAAQPRREGLRPESDRARASRDSVDLILGQKRIYLQQPKYYYFPGPAQVQFHERNLCPWFDDVEAATADIRCESWRPSCTNRMPSHRTCRATQTGPKSERDGDDEQPRAWSAYYLWKNGEPVAGNVERFPKTMQALRNAPLAHVPNRSPSILFSLLRPGAHIPPHNGLVNTRFICHLPVIDPAKCRFRVGNETRDWVEGKGWAFG